MNGPNAKVSINQLVFRSIYYKYQLFVVPLVTILVCILLFWFVVMGQIQYFFSVKDQITVNERDLQVLHQNLKTVTSLDDASLTTTLTVATQALPIEKDFAGIVNSLQTAASIAGVSLEDYSLQIGNLSGLTSQGKSAQLPVQLNVILKGSISQAQVFIHQLKNQFPLSDSVAISISGDKLVTVTCVFYYAQLPKIVFKDTSLLPSLEKDDQQLLTTLAAQSSLKSVILPSPSAVPSPSLSPTQRPTSSVSPSPITSPTNASGSAQ